MEGRNDSGKRSSPSVAVPFGEPCSATENVSLKSIRPFHYNGDTL